MASLLIFFLPALVLAVAGLWGSVLALRGRKWWATWCMAIGSGMALLGPIVSVLGQVITFYPLGSGSGPSPSSMASGMSVMLIVGIIGAVVSVGGMLAFTIGFVAFCARSGATERRAADLEGMLAQLQARFRNEP